MANHSRPEPLIDQAKLDSAVHLLASAGLALGFYTSDIAQQIGTGATAAIAGGFAAYGVGKTIWNVVVNRKHVTPVADPQNDEGQKLVPAAESPAVTPSAERIVAGWDDAEAAPADPAA